MEKEEPEKTKKKIPLELDWNVLFRSKDDGPPPEVEVVGHKDHHLHQKKKNQEEQSVQSECSCLESMPDYELKDKIGRLRGQVKDLASKLRDKGLKLRASLKQHEDELERRSRVRLPLKDGEECQKSAESDSLHFIGKRNCLSSEAASSHAYSQSSFTSLFSQKLEGKERNCGNLLNTRIKGILSNNGREENKVSSKKSSFQCLTSCSVDKNNRISNNVEKVISCSNFYLHNLDGNSSSFSKRRKASGAQTSVNLRNRKTQTVVLVDEDDGQPMKETEQEDGAIEWKESKIYYPSRDDPECVELFHSDIDCLAPEAFLSSTIMNFYIRYLQRPVSATGKSRSDYYFFSTYFYGKLKEAISYKGNDKDAFYVKFRRWWKGVNIFQKAYILLPIHENLHWSLAIICIPDKEDESGPIILHLDSLGYHTSSQIFQNVKSYLIEEWSYLKPKVVPSDLPISEKIWKHLNRRIDGKTIMVPQQKNDYDCGIFVLFFMERFIDEAPERLKKKDLAKFGRQWFKPEEASGLRVRIRKLLLEEFDSARVESDSRESSPASSDDVPVGCNGCATDS